MDDSVQSPSEPQKPETLPPPQMDNAMDCVAQGDRALADGRYDDALKAYAEALLITPHYTKAHRKRGLVRYAQGDLDGAIEEWDKAFESEWQR